MTSGIGRVKVFCHTCNGVGKVPDISYPDGKEILVLCPECRGEKFVYVDVET